MPIDHNSRKCMTISLLPRSGIMVEARECAIPPPEILACWKIFLLSENFFSKNTRFWSVNPPFRGNLGTNLEF